MGGVGKTTLAKHIHDHLLKNRNFKIYWVTVSQEFNIKKLQDDIAKCLGLDPWNEDDEHIKAAILSEALVQGSVLILDDVWKEIPLKEIGICHGANKCRLIFTTRSRQVCTGMDCQRELEVKTLDKNESWDLFKTTLRLKMELPADVEKVAQSVTERCAGLPLGIVTVAGSMKGATDIREWRNALEQLKACSVGYDAMEEKVFPILEWSFNRLNKCEKNCFLYCCLYPEDSKLKIKELIDLFIWAELMQERNSWSQEFDQGHAILNKLIKVCLLEETRGYGGGDCVKMHDLVRDMALRITDGKSNLQMNGDVPRFLVKSIGKGNSKVTLEPKKWTEDLHAVSFHSFSYPHPEIKVPPAWSPNCPKLSTLLLSDVSIKEIPDSFFRHMCGLKVLNLSRCEGITELPNSVSELVKLTALILRGCKDLRFVPPLGNLKQLRDLDLSFTKIEDLPQGLESLVNLQRLNLDECGAFSQKIIPKGTFSQLHRLQLLLLPPYPRVQVNDPEVLNQLESFEGCLSFTDFYKITRWPKYYNKQLHFHQCELGRGSNNLPDDMESLIIQDCEGMGIRSLSDVFRNFINLSHLFELEITDVVGIEFLWQLSSASPRDQLEVSYFSPLCDLQVLSLSGLPNLVGLFYGESEPSYLLPAGTFSSLRELNISKCHNMKQLFTVQLLQSLQNLETLTVIESGIFSSLKGLNISKCHNMKQLFTVQLLQSLQNLETLTVNYCEVLEEIAADGNGVGQGGGEGTQLTSCEGATATVINLPKLRRLRLDNLPQLKNICKAAMICNSIEDIAIFGCPNLKRLPLFLSTINGQLSLPSTLSKIRGDKEWWESLEWDYPSAKNALDPYFTTE
ncbi:unnamed protein product [Coffea canephora]|uniref:DH200=94 genomic scaffold, scaffold_163 n=1 Tax=Coffea canephora TaxID=49390 RepID=A0A068V9N1_COFCA|nr:unnamed protein product [Coffea canephora]